MIRTGIRTTTGHHSRRALEIVLSADEFSAEQGELYGFVNRVVDDAELDEFVDKFARRLASFPKRSLYVGKKLVNACTYVPSETVRPEFGERGLHDNRSDAGLELMGLIWESDDIRPVSSGTVLHP